MLYNKKNNHLIGGALATGADKSIGQRYAVFASCCYLKTDQEKYDFLKKYNKINWIIDDQFTNIEITTFHKVETGETVIAINGTDWTKSTDVIADAYLLVGNSAGSSKAKRMIDIVGKIIAKYGKTNTCLASHSLGAEISRLCANKYGIKAYLYNRGTGFGTPFETKNKDINEYTTNYGKNTDIVSLIGSMFKNHTNSEFETNQKGDTHTINNFLGQNQSEIDLTGTGVKRRGVFINHRHRR
jgi:hypothetical protein